MSVRSLWPWLIVGVLLASVCANVAMYAGRGSSNGAPAPSSRVDPGVIGAHHLAPNSLDERCPTLDQLGLTQAQRDEIRKHTLTSLDVRTDLAIEVSKASEELDKLLSSAPADDARVFELADRISDLRSRQYRSWIGSILVVRDVLTTEQLQQLREVQP